MKKKENAAKRYSTIKTIYNETYREDISRKMREKASEEKENCS
jgi:hypothetical protein